MRIQKMHPTWENELQGQAQAVGPVLGPKRPKGYGKIMVLAATGAIYYIFCEGCAKSHALTP